MTNNTEFNKARKHFLRGEYRESIMAFHGALEHGMDPGLLHMPLGLAYFKNGDFPEAVEVFSHALEIDPENDHVFFLRGIARFNNSELDKALDDFNDAIRLNGGRGAAYVARSLALKVMHRFAEAENDLRTALFLADVEVESFIKEYCISSTMYKMAMSLFDVGKESWTEDLRERRMKVEH
ncbi:MAG: tetratricopeptide repeat protein [Thermodesulfobacteriota bacterium]